MGNIMENFLQNARNNLIENRATQDEIKVLRKAYANGEILTSGDIKNSVILIGNNNQVIQMNASAFESITSNFNETPNLQIAPNYRKIEKQEMLSENSSPEDENSRHVQALVKKAITNIRSKSKENLQKNDEQWNKFVAIVTPFLNSVNPSLSNIDLEFDSRLKEDLELDELDFVELIEHIKDHYGIDIEFFDTQKITTLGELYYQTL